MGAPLWVDPAELMPSGQRQYSADDLRRLVLIMQLTDVGHAIDSLAALDLPQLQRVASTHAQALVVICEALATAGSAMLRAPQPDSVVAQWLNSLSAPAASRAASAPQPAPGLCKPAAVPPRHWDDAPLADFANCRRRWPASARALWPHG